MDYYVYRIKTRYFDGVRANTLEQSGAMENEKKKDQTRLNFTSTTRGSHAHYSRAHVGIRCIRIEICFAALNRHDCIFRFGYTTFLRVWSSPQNHNDIIYIYTNYITYTCRLYRVAPTHRVIYVHKKCYKKCYVYLESSFHGYSNFLINRMICYALVSMSLLLSTIQMSTQCTDGNVSTSRICFHQLRYFFYNYVH